MSFALTSIGLGLASFALLSGQPDGAPAALAAVEDEEQVACQPTPTIPTVVQGRRTFLPSLARLGPIRTGAYVGRTARLPVSRARDADYFTGKLFYVIPRTAADRIDITGTLLPSGRPLEFQTYVGDEVRWVTRNVLRKKRIARERGARDGGTVFMPGGIRARAEGCVRLSATWNGRTRSIQIRLDRQARF